MEYPETPMIFIIQTKAHGVIGCYSSAMWRFTNGKYISPECPDSECVFWLKSGLEDEVRRVYFWSPGADVSDGLLYAGPSALAFGSDGAAISLDADLSRGVTSPSRAFGPLALLDDGSGNGSSVDFEALEIEVFSLV
eukprot:gnl/MRDRNA2_/MRDRNA2_514365_c0_seq1.p1 gnl/MRDRNA2_/MRDRNA2_514365_c0~~gnl/MRDRNA2_/MRDRNA2_514365_c0_seq1.p1  ORF type:complete len:137 (+),score=19.88 gnl/MRDRNA2_/MRDRNA2_514365_c0_seq1:2-412(+)